MFVSSLMPTRPPMRSISCTSAIAPACLSMSVIASSAASSLPSWARQAMQRARTRTVILKCEPRPAARGLTLRPMQLSPTRQASMALLRQRTSLQKSPANSEKSCHFSFAEHHCWPCQQWRCRRSCCGLQGTRHDGETATLMLRITCRSSASAAWRRLLQTLCWRFARNAS